MASLDNIAFASLVIAVLGLVLTAIFYYMGSVELNKVDTRIDERVSRLEKLDEILLRHITNDSSVYIGEGHNGDPAATFPRNVSETRQLTENVTAVVTRGNQSQ